MQAFKSFLNRLFALVRLTKTTAFWVFLVLPASLWWWWRVAMGNNLRCILLIAVALAAFMIGCLIGFLFSSYGEELSTIGKIRDWLIGGLSGLTVAEAIHQGGFVKTILLKFAINQSDMEFSLVISMAVVYWSLGFLFMFFQRELILNVVLAKSRAARGQLDGTKQTGLAIQKLLAQLSPGVLSGTTDISETKVSKKELDDLKTALYSEDVTTFLKQADEALRYGMVLDWDTVSKVANVHYYRSYFETEEQKPLEVKRALDWIRRALAINPLHADLTMKYADMLGFDNQVDAAVAVLETLSVRPESPAVVKQWLGYYLRSNPARLDDSIKYSKQFLSMFPNDDAALAVLAYAYGVKYSLELRALGKTSEPASPNRAAAFQYLEAVLRLYPEFKSTVADKWIKERKGFECLADDPDFKKIVS